MKIIITILEQIILPLFILIGIGGFLHKIFKFDMKSLSKINLYYLLPAVIFSKIYQTTISVDLLFYIFIFFILQFFFLYIISIMLSRILSFEKDLTASFTNSVVLKNSGNFGLPINDLVFNHDPFAMSIQIVFMILQNFLTFTFGLFNAGAAKNGIKAAIINYFKIPVFYALALGVVFNLANISIPSFISIPIGNISNGFLAVALLTLGAQVASYKLGKHSFTVVLGSVVILMIAPIFAYAIIHLLGLKGVLAQALFISSGFPTARNSAILALEYGNNPDFAAQAVIVSTLFSSVTITVVIYLAKVFF